MIAMIAITTKSSIRVKPPLPRPPLPGTARSPSHGLGLPPPRAVGGTISQHNAPADTTRSRCFPAFSPKPLHKRDPNAFFALIKPGAPAKIWATNIRRIMTSLRLPHAKSSFVCHNSTLVWCSESRELITSPHRWPQERAANPAAATAINFRSMLLWGSVSVFRLSSITTNRKSTIMAPA